MFPCRTSQETVSQKQRLCLQTGLVICWDRCHSPKRHRGSPLVSGPLPVLFLTPNTHPLTGVCSVCSLSVREALFQH